MGLFGNLFGRKKAAAPAAESATSPPETAASDAGEGSPTAAAAGRTYFFICSGNPSLIAAHDSLLKLGVLPWNGEAGHYTFSAVDLESRAGEAESAGIVFSGERFMGSSCSTADTVGEVLRSMRVGVLGDTHVAFAVVDGEGVAWVRGVYDQLLEEAMSQGILPYYMYVTTDEGAARFLLESFSSVA